MESSVLEAELTVAPLSLDGNYIEALNLPPPLAQKTSQLFSSIDAFILEHTIPPPPVCIIHLGMGVSIKTGGGTGYQTDKMSSTVPLPPPLLRSKENSVLSLAETSPSLSLTHISNDITVTPAKSGQEQIFSIPEYSLPPGTNSNELKGSLLSLDQRTCYESYEDLVNTSIKVNIDGSPLKESETKGDGSPSLSPFGDYGIPPPLSAGSDTIIRPISGDSNTAEHEEITGASEITANTLLNDRVSQSINDNTVRSYMVETRPISLATVENYERMSVALPLDHKRVIQPSSLAITTSINVNQEDIKTIIDTVNVYIHGSDGRCVSVSLTRDSKIKVLKEFAATALRIEEDLNDFALIMDCDTGPVVLSEHLTYNETFEDRTAKFQLTLERIKPKSFTVKIQIGDSAEFKDIKVTYFTTVREALAILLSVLKDIGGLEQWELTSSGLFCVCFSGDGSRFLLPLETPFMKKMNNTVFLQKMPSKPIVLDVNLLVPIHFFGGYKRSICVPKGTQPPFFLALFSKSFDLNVDLFDNFKLALFDSNFVFKSALTEQDDITEKCKDGMLCIANSQQRALRVAEFENIVSHTFRKTLTGTSSVTQSSSESPKPLATNNKATQSMVNLPLSKNSSLSESDIIRNTGKSSAASNKDQQDENDNLSDEEKMTAKQKKRIEKLSNVLGLDKDVEMPLLVDSKNSSLPGSTGSLSEKSAKKVDKILGLSDNNLSSTVTKKKNFIKSILSHESSSSYSSLPSSKEKEI